MRWSIADIADCIEAGLRERARADDLEQAVYGFDALDELGLHPLIQRALRAGGYGVWPEQRYPGDWHKRRRSEGRRCDIVLTREGLPLRDPELKDTLFDTDESEDAAARTGWRSRPWRSMKRTGRFGGIPASCCRRWHRM